jgi:hypothetical protein
MAMSKNSVYLFLCFVVISIVGCATEFTESKIDKLRLGMSSGEVREMFGTPNEVRSAVCGSATASGQWICETWTYKNPITDGRNDFTFSVKQDSKVLNSWNVKR